MKVEHQRKAQLVEATIHEIGANGSLDVTVGKIAKRAGVSAALAFHYFGDKDRLFLAAMRHVLSVYGAEVRGALLVSDGSRARLEGILRASFSSCNFRAEVISAWLNFYVLARRNEEARRLLSVYHRRLRSNLLHDLRPLSGAAASDIAERIGAVIDGLYLRYASNPDDMTGQAASDHALATLSNELGALA